MTYTSCGVEENFDDMTARLTTLMIWVNRLEYCNLSRYSPCAACGPCQLICFNYGGLLQRCKKKSSKEKRFCVIKNVL